MNPCIDCRIYMLKKAKEYAETIGAELIVTGEVLGQRHMSQHRAALKKIESEAGLKGRLLRPLSAKCLPETEAERKGWVNREKLLNITGRSRKVPDCGSPLTILQGPATAQSMRLSAEITAAYSDAADENVRVKFYCSAARGDMTVRKPVKSVLTPYRI